MKTTYCNPLDLGYRYQHMKEDGKRAAHREGADPTLVRFKGRYYLFVSMSAGFWHSPDLLNWEFHANPDLLIYDYAPDVRQIGEYLYFCASRRGVNCPILRTADPLKDDFTQVSAPFDFWDPDLFQDDDGRVYLYWGCGNTDPIYSVEMDPVTMLPIGKPYIEGAYMTKHGGKYYLQYACPATEYNTYSDGVYVSDRPLGPFILQESNPFSSKPGGFISGAGHGSTIADEYGNYWHASTMRVSVNHAMERRVGLFPAGFDQDGVLFCNQNFADYPLRVPHGKFDAAALGPEWMLLSYRKPVSASSTAEGSGAALAVDEDIRTWWSAGTDEPGQWLTVDLEKISDVRAIQVNLADEALAVDLPEESYGDDRHTRCIELEPQLSRYTIEASADGENWTLLEDAARECSNGYFEYPEGVRARFIRLTGGALPYGQTLRVSGLRVFGKGDGAKPPKAAASARRTGDLDGVVRWGHMNSAQGCNVRYGIAPDKLYQSWLVYGADEVKLCTLMKGRDYYVRVDSFNENGITEGDVLKMEGGQ